MLDLAIKFDIIHKAGAWFNATINDNDYKWQGQSKVLDALNSDENLFKTIKEKVNMQLLENPNIDDED